MHFTGYFIFMLCAISRVQSTCVLESEFGFTLNCAFKKSGLFRVRNLGGLKAHVGLGFSLGDELGFKESLSNVEGNKRRSVQVRNGANEALIGVQPSNKNTVGTKRGLTVRQPPDLGPPAVSLPLTPAVQTGRMASNVPAFKPIPPADERPASQQVQKAQAQALLAQQAKAQQHAQQARAQLAQQLKAQQQSQQQAQLVQQAQQLLQAQRNFPINMRNYTRPLQISSVANNLVKPAPIYRQAVSVPAFQAMPESVSRISTGATILVDNSVEQNKVRNSIIPANHRPEDPMLEPLPSPMPTKHRQNIPSLDAVFPQVNINRPVLVTPVPSSSGPALSKLEIKPELLANGTHLMGHSVQDLADATNISVEAIQAAILLRQQQLMNQHQMIPTRPPTTTTTTTTTPRPLPMKKHTQVTATNKVMNAPREYYPVGYEKNFDDNFASRVELPETSFYCGDQKHFPGLYADEDLGCMVFHVCALTDDGLIMKSFLCPESTLFDQTILKCNWWFYVDCKSSRKLYDSNIPISKSYQLMKALTFFSTYKKDQGVKVQGQLSPEDIAKELISGRLDS